MHVPKSKHDHKIKIDFGAFPLFFFGGNFFRSFHGFVVFYKRSIFFIRYSNNIIAFSPL